ncbi:MAG: AAA family ATPase, partial [bacterium]|nr:AAA family ATPase [bacterium]
MYLAALDLTGFKSFAKKTRLVFAPGVTCIVGPNGSGKSGIADGIRWVLGEQSLKSIRAKRGDEVIFQGSRSRGRLGMAEVSLTLADAETVNLDMAEVMVTRRVDRTGASAYLVND